MRTENEKVFLEEICPELDKCAWHIRPKRGEDIEDIKQELKACAVWIIDWLEKKAEMNAKRAGKDLDSSPLIKFPRAIVQRSVRYIISGRRFFNQKKSDVMQVERDSGDILEYNDEIVEHASTAYFSPFKMVQMKLDFELIEKKVGETNMRIIDMLLGGYKQRDIAEELGFTDAKMSNHIKQLFSEIRLLLGIPTEEDNVIGEADDENFEDLELFSYQNENTLREEEEERGVCI